MWHQRHPDWLSVGIGAVEFPDRGPCRRLVLVDHKGRARGPSSSVIFDGDLDDTTDAGEETLSYVGCLIGAPIV